MDADGSDMRRVTNTASGTMTHRGGPIGTRLAFNRYNGHIWTINVDGSDEQRITPDQDPISWSQWEGTPIWSPDGTELAANGTRIYEVDELPFSFVLSVADPVLKVDASRPRSVSHRSGRRTAQLEFGSYCLTP